MNFDAYKQIRIGDPVEKITSVFGGRAKLETDPESPGFSFFHFEEVGVWYFASKDRVISTIRFNAPFAGEIEGCKIGQLQKEVLKAKGTPTRKWPIDDGIARWIYEQGAFLRLDFDADTKRVAKIFL